jgi:hypothetical protein
MAEVPIFASKFWVQHLNARTKAKVEPLMAESQDVHGPSLHLSLKSQQFPKSVSC